MSDPRHIGQPDLGRLIPEASAMMRTFNTCTRGRGALEYPSEAAKYIGALHELFGLLSPSVSQMKTGLDEHRSTLPLYTNAYTDLTPEEVYEELGPLLDRVAAMAGEAEHLMSRAHVLANYLGVTDDEDNTTPEDET